jgi:hypothetical protein
MAGAEWIKETTGKEVRKVTRARSQRVSQAIVRAGSHFKETMLHFIV